VPESRPRRDLPLGRECNRLFTSTIACHGHDAIPCQTVFLPCRHLSPTREICDNIGNPADDVRAHESSRNFLDSRSRVYRIPTDWPGPANFQQPLNYGRIPWSANRISPSHHVHSPGGAPTKTCFDCTFHRRNPAGLGHFPRKPRLRAKAKALIQTGRTEAGALSFFTPFIGDMPRTLPLHRMILSEIACGC
jgi:hypothetical protein